MQGEKNHANLKAVKQQTWWVYRTVSVLRERLGLCSKAKSASVSLPSESQHSFQFQSFLYKLEPTNTAMAFLSKEITGLDLVSGAIFLREVLAGYIFGARHSEYVDLEISSCFVVSLFRKKWFLLFDNKWWWLPIVQAGFHSWFCSCVSY